MPENPLVSFSIYTLMNISFIELLSQSDLLEQPLTMPCAFVIYSNIKPFCTWVFVLMECISDFASRKANSTSGKIIRRSKFLEKILFREHTGFVIDDLTF
jgi:hypothetical protein